MPVSKALDCCDLHRRACRNDNEYDWTCRPAFFPPRLRHIGLMPTNLSLKESRQKQFCHFSPRGRPARVTDRPRSPATLVTFGTKPCVPGCSISETPPLPSQIHATTLRLRSRKAAIPGEVCRFAWISTARCCAPTCSTS